MAAICAFKLAAPLALLALAACATTRSAPMTPFAAALAKPAFKQNDLLGLDAAGLDKRLGAPALVRREGAGEFRRYGLAGCALIVILYPNENGAETAAHLDAAARTSNEEKPDLALCLARGL